MHEMFYSQIQNILNQEVNFIKQKIEKIFLMNRRQKLKHVELFQNVINQLQQQYVQELQERLASFLKQTKKQFRKMSTLCKQQLKFAILGIEDQPQFISQNQNHQRRSERSISYHSQHSQSSMIHHDQNLYGQEISYRSQSSKYNQNQSNKMHNYSKKSRSKSQSKSTKKIQNMHEHERRSINNAKSYRQQDSSSYRQQDSSSYRQQNSQALHIKKQDKKNNSRQSNYVEQKRQKSYTRLLQNQELSQQQSLAFEIEKDSKLFKKNKTKPFYDIQQQDSTRTQTINNQQYQSSQNLPGLLNLVVSDELSMIQNQPKRNIKQEIKQQYYLKQQASKKLDTLKEKNHFWLIKRTIQIGDFSYYFDLRPLTRNFIVRKDNFQLMINQNKQNNPLQVLKFLQFYRINQEFISPYIVVKQIKLNTLIQYEPYISIQQTDYKQIQKISFQTHQRFFDSLQSYEFQKFLLFANGQSKNNKDIKIQIKVNFLPFNLMKILSKIKFNSQIIIEINNLTKQTYSMMKILKLETPQKITFKSSKVPILNNQKKALEQIQINMNMGKLSQKREQYDALLKNIIKLQEKVQKIIQKSSKLRYLYLQCYKQDNQTLFKNNLDFHQLQNDLFKLYNSTDGRNFTLRIVSCISNNNVINELAWPQVQTIIFENVFTGKATQFHIKNLTKEMIKNKFMNVKTIIIDLVGINSIKQSPNIRDPKREMHFNQSTIKHIYELTQKFKKIRFKFIQSVQNNKPIYWQQDNYEFMRIKKFFIQHKIGNKIVIKSDIQQQQQIQPLDRKQQKQQNQQMTLNIIKNVLAVGRLLSD